MSKKPRKRVRNTAAQNPLLHLAEAMVAGSSSGMVINQEERGAAQMAVSDQLPAKGLDEIKAAFKAAGGTILQATPGDPMFVNVLMPRGWKKVRTDHSMWTNLVDEKGNKRASIFYKAAFYDRDAFMHGCRRLSAGYGFQDVHADRPDQEYFPEIRDGDKTVWRGKLRKHFEQTREQLLANEPDAGRLCAQEAQALLTQLYPDWQKQDAYWDLDTLTFPPNESEPPAGDEYKFNIGIYRLTEDGEYVFADGGHHCERKFTSDQLAQDWWDAHVRKGHLTHYAKITCTITKGSTVVAKPEIILQRPKARRMGYPCDIHGRRHDGRDFFFFGR